MLNRVKKVRGYVNGEITSKPHQVKLKGILQSLFPDDVVHTNARRVSGLVSPLTGYFMELDFWIPNKKLAFEYQESHHFSTSWYSSRTIEHVQQLDQTKKRVAGENGITLIEIPYWWDFKVESLIASIRKERPELLSSLSLHSSSSPIPSEPPAEQLPKKMEVPDVGELMVASFPLSNKIDISNWWMSEKLDGIRAVWNPITKKLYQRSGREIALPFYFYPLINSSLFLDGELWFGRRKYYETKYLLAGNIEEANWADLRFCIFDSPHMEGTSFLFEDRIRSLMLDTPVNHTFIIPVSHSSCQSQDSLQKNIINVINYGGEGMIARRPSSLYSSGVSDSFLKYKAERDEEALVVDVKHPSYYIKQIQDDTIREVRLSSTYQNENYDLPNTGDVVSISLGPYTTASTYSDRPLFTKITKVRKDVSWPEAVESFHRHFQMRSVTTYTQTKLSQVTKTNSPGHWTIDGGINVRLFFDEFAHSNGFDPLVAINWYKYDIRQRILDAKGDTILQHFGSVANALQDTYPEIDIDVSKFERKSPHFWSKENARRICDEFAKDNGFDPLDSEAWYSVSNFSSLRQKIKPFFQTKDVKNASFLKVLMSLYPDVLTDRAKFKYFALPFHEWKEISNRRRVMDRMAKVTGLDPIDPETWYNFDIKEFLGDKEVNSLYKHYGLSIRNMSLATYPDIGLVITRFPILPVNYWNSIERRKEFFDNVAEKNNFDPLVVSNWNNFHFTKMRKEKRFVRVLKHYGGSVTKALASVYPELPPVNPLYPLKLRYHWTVVENRKKFFEDFAKEQRFDSQNPNNWYHYIAQDFGNIKGGQGVLTHYGDSVSKALIGLFPELEWDPSKFRKTYNYKATTKEL